MPQPCEQSVVVHLGLPRTGTTTIQHILAEDPRIQFTSRRIFQLPELRAIYRDSSMDSRGTLVVSDETLLRQDGSYSKMAVTLWRIRSISQSAKLVLTIREQRDWLSSRYKYGVGTGTVSCSFEEWLKSRQGSDFVSLAHYGALCRTILAFFPRDQLVVLPFELLRDNYSEFFRQLYETLELEPIDLPPGVRRNQSMAPSLLHWKRRANRLSLFQHAPFSPRARRHSLQAAALTKLARIAHSVFGNHDSASSEEYIWPDTEYCSSLLEDFAISNLELERMMELGIINYGYAGSSADSMT